jgi:hypothetical protein
MADESGMSSPEQALLPEHEKCIFCDVAAEYAEVLDQSGIRDPVAWIESQLEQVALDLVFPRGIDIDRLWDWHDHLLALELKRPNWPRTAAWETVTVAQQLPLRTMSRNHATLVVVHVRSMLDIIRNSGAEDFWVSDIRWLDRGVNPRSRFLACSLEQLISARDVWNAAADDCDTANGCWSDGCPHSGPESFRWWEALGYENPPGAV